MGEPREAAGPRSPLVFPYRALLKDMDGSVEIIDPLMPPVLLEVSDRATLTIDDVPWYVAALDDENERVLTEDEFEREPTYRIATVHLRRQSKDRAATV